MEAIPYVLATLIISVGLTVLVCKLFFIPKDEANEDEHGDDCG